MSSDIKVSEGAEWQDYFKDKTVLVTGAFGYLAYHLRKLLEKTSCRLIVPGVQEGDVRRPDFWQPFQGVDVIFHLAAQTSAYTANQSPAEDIAVNLMPVVYFIETACRTGNRPDFIFAGTVTQAGLTDLLPVNESFCDRPVTVYDINKSAAEKYLAYYASQLGGRSAVLRLANLYGPGPSGKRSDRGIVNLMVRKALAGEDLTVYGQGDFIRDYVYVEDAAEAFMLAAGHMEKLSGGYYIIAGGKGASINDMVNVIAEKVCQRTGLKVAVRNIDPPETLSPIEFRNFVGDSSRFMKATGWHPRVPLEEGIDRTIRFMEEARA